MKLINLTPHTVNVYNGDEVIAIEPSGTVARVESKQEITGHINGIPIVKTVFGNLIGLPEPEDGTVYVVSTLAAQAAAALGRTDVVSPDTTPDSVVRDESGKIVGVRRFQTF